MELQLILSFTAFVISVFGLIYVLFTGEKTCKLRKWLIEAQDEATTAKIDSARWEKRYWKMVEINKGHEKVNAQLLAELKKYKKMEIPF